MACVSDKKLKEIGWTNAESPGVQFIWRALKRACLNDGLKPETIARAMARHRDLVQPFPIEQ